MRSGTNRLCRSSWKYAIFLLVFSFSSLTYFRLLPSWSILKPFESSVIVDDRYFFGMTASLEADVPKRDAVVAAFKHAWHAYERDAMGSDEYYPIRHNGANFSVYGGIGYTIVDAIDTMYIMGLRPEYETARRWIETELNFERAARYSTFETTIRVLGGLLSSYHLTADKLYLNHAEDLGHRLIKAFNTTSGLPLPFINLGNSQSLDGSIYTGPAEAGSLQLEFKYLAELTKNETFWYKSEHAMSVIKAALPSSNLVPTVMNVHDGSFRNSVVRLGSSADSYYEYLLKQYLQTDRTESVYQDMYNKAMQAISDELVQKTPMKHLTYISELAPEGPASAQGVQMSWRTQHRQEHLVCFLAGSLMLGATTSGSRTGKVSVPPRSNEFLPHGLRDWKMGIDLLEGCMSTHETATGLSPEIVTFRSSQEELDEFGRDWSVPRANNGQRPYDARYMLRPETIESLFVAWRLTGNQRYRDYAWRIFSSIEEYARVPEGGYATVLDVDQVPVELLDKQETFFMSETLKYLYLIFSDSSVLPVHEIVFNTEAHPLPIFRPTFQPAFS